MCFYGLACNLNVDIKFKNFLRNYKDFYADKRNISSFAKLLRFDVKVTEMQWNILKNINPQFKTWHIFLYVDYLSKTKEFHLNTQQIYEEQNLG
jgi:hypothetical protein